MVRDNKNQDRVRAVFRFDKRLPNLSSIFTKNWDIMCKDDIRLKSVFPNPPMICYTRGKNMREELCTAKLPPARARLREQEDGFMRCRDNCRLCPYTGLRPEEVKKTFTISSTGNELPIRGKMTCQSSNLLYIGECLRGSGGGGTCPDRLQYGGYQYCGETGKTAEARFVGHKNSIVQQCNEGTSLPEGEHFQSVGHSLPDFRFTPVEKIFSNNIFVRKARERMWINNHDLIRSGLNKKI